MKKIFAFYFLMLLVFISTPIVTDAETTTSDTVVIETPEETTTEDTIIIDIPEEEITTDDTIIITPPEEELRPIDYVHQLQDSGKMSNEFVERIMIDLTSVENGVVIVKHYSGIEQSETIKTINIQSKTEKEAKDIITRFSLSLSKRYQPDAYLLISNNETENVSYVYSVGEQRIGAIINIYDGIGEALGKPPVKYGNDNDWVDKYNPIVVDNEVKILTPEQIEEYKKSLAEMNTQIVNYISDNKYVQFFINTVLSIF